MKRVCAVVAGNYLARHLIPRFGTRLALTITTADMAALHAEIGSKHPYAANRLFETKRRRFVTPDELPQLSKAIEQELADCRPAPIYGIRVGDFDPATGGDFGWPPGGNGGFDSMIG